MRLNRGCGCLLLVLAGVDLVLVIAATVSFFMGDTGVGYAALGLFLFGANMVAAFLVGLAAVRGMPLGTRIAARQAGELGGQDEGQDTEDESSDE